MEKELLTTEFASPERSTQDEIRRQSELLSGSSQFAQFANYVPDPVLVLNQNRQIVFGNAAAIKVVETVGSKEPLGLRPGEALRCEHAFAARCGCGTSSFCRYCGSVKAILSALRGVEDVQECRVSQEGGGETLLFMCYTYPLEIGTETFCLFILKDITRERRMHILEHVFFHDIKNTLTALNGWVNLLNSAESPDQVREVTSVLTDISNDLVDEVNAQEQLMGAESNRLATHVGAVNSLALLKEMAALYQKHDVARGKDIAINPRAASVEMRSDASLLKRVLGNMTRNAFEAIDEGQVVTLDCTRAGDQVAFQVHNPGTIPPDVQAQIFKWSFSTKGKGRGLGTYGMKLLSERYLGGKVSFTSAPKKGTTFAACFPLSLD